MESGRSDGNLFGRWRCRSTIGTATPVGDFGFVDFESVHVRCFEAGSVADRAIDIDDVTALPADEMVVIVSDAIFVQSRRADRLDSPDQPFVDQEAESVVDGLARNGADVGLRSLGDVVSGAVWMKSDGPQDRETLGGDMKAMPSQHVCIIGDHNSENRQIWTQSKIWKM